jgi:hypothetical protein
MVLFPGRNQHLLKLNGSVNGNGHATAHHNDLYTKVENSAKYLYNGTRDFIWSIDPVNDELSKLFIHIRDFGEKLFEEKDIGFRANNGVTATATTIITAVMAATATEAITAISAERSRI